MLITFPVRPQMFPQHSDQNSHIKLERVWVPSRVWRLGQPMSFVAQGMKNIVIYEPHLTFFEAGSRPSVSVMTKSEIWKPEGSQVSSAPCLPPASGLCHALFLCSRRKYSALHWQAPTTVCLRHAFYVSLLYGSIHSLIPFIGQRPCLLSCRFTNSKDPPMILDSLVVWYFLTIPKIIIALFSLQKMLIFSETYFFCYIFYNSVIISVINCYRLLDIVLNRFVNVYTIFFAHCWSHTKPIKILILWNGF